MDLLRLWYVDEEYLNSLYNQLSENITQLIVSEEKSSDREGLFGLSLNDIITRFTFPIGISLRTRYNIKKNVVTEKTITPSTEHKILELQKNINKKIKLKELILHTPNANGIICISDNFTLLELYYQGNKSNSLIREPDFIEHPAELVWHFHWSMKVDNSKRLYENSPELIKEVSVEMFAGGDKIKRNIKHITTSIEKYHLFDFSIIGDLHKIDNCTYTIKPIVRA